MRLFSKLYFSLLMASSISCQNPSSSEPEPPSQRHPAADQSHRKNAQGARGKEVSSKNPASPVLTPGSNGDNTAPNSPATNADKGTTPVTPSGQSTGAIGAQSPATPSSGTPSTSASGDDLAPKVSQLQDQLTAFDALVRANSQAAEGPVSDAKQYLSDALALAQALASTQDPGDRSLLIGRIQLKLATSRSALTRSRTAALSAGTWKDELGQAYQVLVSQYQPLLP